MFLLAIKCYGSGHLDRGHEGKGEQETVACTCAHTTFSDRQTCVFPAAAGGVIPCCCAIYELLCCSLWLKGYNSAVRPDRWTIAISLRRRLRSCQRVLNPAAAQRRLPRYSTRRRPAMRVEEQIVYLPSHYSAHMEHELAEYFVA